MGSGLRAALRRRRAWEQRLVRNEPGSGSCQWSGCRWFSRNWSQKIETLVAWQGHCQQKRCPFVGSVCFSRLITFGAGRWEQRRNGRDGSPMLQYLEGARTVSGIFSYDLHFCVEQDWIWITYTLSCMNMAWSWDLWCSWQPTKPKCDLNKYVSREARVPSIPWLKSKPKRLLVT